MKTAKFIKTVSIYDEDSGAYVDMEVYKDNASGAMFGIDASFVLTLDDDAPVLEPFNGTEVTIIY